MNLAYRAHLFDDVLEELERELGRPVARAWLKHRFDALYSEAVDASSRGTTLAEIEALIIVYMLDSMLLEAGLVMRQRNVDVTYMRGAR